MIIGLLALHNNDDEDLGDILEDGEDLGKILEANEDPGSLETVKTCSSGAFADQQVLEGLGRGADP